MPCHDGGWYNDNPLPSKRKSNKLSVTIDDLKASLCAVLTVAEKHQSVNEVMDQIDWKEAGVERKWLERWWKEHKAEDEARRKREVDSAAKLETMEREILAKLKAKYEV